VGWRVFFFKQGFDMTADELKSLIESNLTCQHMELEGDGRHWFATIVSEEFEGMRAIKRHQRVYQTLGQKMHTDEVHALSMKTFTPQEWALESQPQAANKGA
jgi:acid stress-induced BolA-like protein IbaG/YrbA